MNTRYTYLLLVLFSICTIVTKAQDTIASIDTVSESLILPKANNLFNFRVAIANPTPIRNKAFSKTFVGIYQVGGNLNLSINKGFYMGVGFSSSHFKVAKSVIPTYVANMNAYNASLKVGGDFIVGVNNRGLISTSISVGQSYVKYSSFTCKTPGKTVTVPDFKAIYVEADFSLIYLVDSYWGIGPTLSYSVINRSFDPYELCLDDWSSYNRNNHGATQYLNLGFVVYYSFLRK